MRGEGQTQDREGTSLGPKPSSTINHLGEGGEKEGGRVTTFSQLFTILPHFFWWWSWPSRERWSQRGSDFFASVLSFLVEKLVSYERNEDHEETFGTDITCTI